jgi:hypothetical protein
LGKEGRLGAKQKDLGRGRNPDRGWQLQC